MVKLERKGVQTLVKWLYWHDTSSRNWSEEGFIGYYLGQFRVNNRSLYVFYDPKYAVYYISFYLEGFNFSEIPVGARVEIYRRGDWEIYYDPDDIRKDIPLHSLFYNEEALQDIVKIRTGI